MKKHLLDKRENLANIENKHIVYVDEAGISNQEYYPYGYSFIGERCYALKSGRKTKRVS